MLSTDPEDEAWMVGMLRGSTPAERRGKHIFEQVLLFRKRRGLNHAKPPSRWRIPVFSLWLPSKATVALQPCLLRQWKAQLPQIQLLLPRQEVSESKHQLPQLRSCHKCLPVSFCDSAVAILGFEYVKKTSENATPELGGKVHWRQTISPSMLWHATIAHQGSNDLFTQKNIESVKSLFPLKKTKCP